MVKIIFFINVCVIMTPAVAMQRKRKKFKRMIYHINQSEAFISTGMISLYRYYSSTDVKLLSGSLCWRIRLIPKSTLQLYKIEIP